MATSLPGRVGQVATFALVVLAGTAGPSSGYQRHHGWVAPSVTAGSGRAWATSATGANVGVNVSGAQYSWENPPSAANWQALAAKGVTLARLPLAWEKLQPSLNGPLNAAQVALLRTSLQAAHAAGIAVIVDIHNNMRFHPTWWTQCPNVSTGSCDSSDGPSIVPAGALANLWRQLAAALAGTPGLAGYDLQNEPYGLPSGFWAHEAQAAISAIRQGDPATRIWVEGDQWAGTRNWAGLNANFPLSDPNHNLGYEGHSYFDADGSSNYVASYTQQGATPQSGVSDTAPFVTWCQAHGVPCWVGEFGVPGNDPQWLPVLDNFLAYITAAGISGTYWGWDADNTNTGWWIAQGNGTCCGDLSLNSAAGTPARPQWAVLGKYFLAAPAPAPTPSPTPIPTPTPVLAESPSGTSVALAGQLVDAHGTVWTLTATGQIARNGVVDPVTARVKMIIYYHGVIYQQAGSAAPYQWWSWNGSSWVGPSPAPAFN